MITLLSILLYLGLISSPNQYYYADIQQIERDNQQAISTVQNDPTQYQTAFDQQHENASRIIIPDYFEEE